MLNAYSQDGERGLVSKQRGRQSNNRLASEVTAAAEFPVGEATSLTGIIPARSFIGSNVDIWADAANISGFYGYGVGGCVGEASGGGG